MKKINTNKNCIRTTSAPIRAWKRNFPAFLGNYDRPTDRRTNQTTGFGKLNMLFIFSKTLLKVNFLKQGRRNKEMQKFLNLKT